MVFVFPAAHALTEPSANAGGILLGAAEVNVDDDKNKLVEPRPVSDIISGDDDEAVDL